MKYHEERKERPTDRVCMTCGMYNIYSVVYERPISITPSNLDLPETGLGDLPEDLATTRVHYCADCDDIVDTNLVMFLNYIEEDRSDPNWIPPEEEGEE